MTEKKDDPSKGNFIAFINLKKDDDDKRPAFQGNLSLPGMPDKRSVALWAYTADNGQIILNGRAGNSANSQIERFAKPPREMVENAAIKVAQNDSKALVIDPHSILLFTNKQKDAENPERPDYWGYYNPAGGERLMKVALWAKTDRYGNAMLTGNLQRDEPQKSAEASKDAEPEMEAPPQQARETLRPKTRKREEERAR